MSTEKFEYTREWTDAEAFPLLSFSRNWENPDDYPTIETDEMKVREDMQSLHDEVKNYLNEQLIPRVIAEDATVEAWQAQENEHAEAEAGRVEAEEARKTAEQERETAETEREKAIAKVENLTVEASTLAPGNKATAEVEVNAQTGGFNLKLGVPAGKDGQGSGDMLASTYDPQGKATDIFKFAADAVYEHNTSSDAHSDIRTFVSNAVSATEALSRFNTGLGNEYLWSKAELSEKLTEHLESRICYGHYGNECKYADSVTLNNDGTVSLNNPTVATLADITNDGTFDLLKGKYFLHSSDAAGKVFYFPTNCSFNSSGSYDYYRALNCIGTHYTVSAGNIVIGYVNSPVPDAYPIGDGYTYNALGQLGGGVRIDLLWENASPSSEFPKQVVNVNFNRNDYSRYMFVFRPHATSIDIISPVMIGAGECGRAQGTEAINSFRNFWFYAQEPETSGADKVEFNVCRTFTGYGNGTPTENNSYLIPWQIYGIKGVTV